MSQLLPELLVLAVGGSIAPPLLLLTILFPLPVLVLTGLYAAVPQRASSMLGTLQAWTVKHNRAITVVICFVFGAFFLLRGLLGS